MKKILFLFSLWLMVGFALAHPVSIRSLNMVGSSDAVYLVRVTSVKDHRDGAYDNRINFSTTHVLRGPSKPLFALTGYEDFNPKVGSEWILLHNPSGFKACVGWAMEGDCEWLPLTVSHQGNETVTEVGSLTKVSDYLASHPYKH
jgi:hypothetical protein